MDVLYGYHGSNLLGHGRRESPNNQEGSEVFVEEVCLKYINFDYLFHFILFYYIIIFLFHHYYFKISLIAIQ